MTFTEQAMVEAAVSGGLSVMVTGRGLVELRVKAADVGNELVENELVEKKGRLASMARMHVHEVDSEEARREFSDADDGDGALDQAEVSALLQRMLGVTVPEELVRVPIQFVFARSRQGGAPASAAIPAAAC